MTERRACKVLDQPRSSQRYESVVADKEESLTEDIISLASEYGRYGYRRITALLKRNGWQVNPPQAEEDLATGRAEGPTKTAQEREAVAQRWVVHKAEADTPQPRLGL